MATYSRWRPHPWHGLAVGPDAPNIVHAYIELTPYDSVKYEIDKETGYLRVDRPQRYSSQPAAALRVRPADLLWRAHQGVVPDVEGGRWRPARHLCAV